MPTDRQRARRSFGRKHYLPNTGGGQQLRFFVSGYLAGLEAGRREKKPKTTDALKRNGSKRRTD